MRVSTGFNVEAVMVREMRVGGTRTLATRLGHWPEMAAVALAVIALAGALPLRRRRRAGAAATDDGATVTRRRHGERARKDIRGWVESS